MQQQLNIVILAAGQGKRMNSALPKVLHPIGTKAMLQHVVETAQSLNPQQLIIVHGHGGEQVQQILNQACPNFNLTWAWQDRQLGTGHALKCALGQLSSTGITLVLYGDVPLISQATLQAMLAKYTGNNLVMLTDNLTNPFGYGRIVRNHAGEIIAIVEEKDATTEQKLIQEINTGFYLLPNIQLASWLHSLSNNNSQGEYYLTDVVALASQQGMAIDYVKAANSYEVLGVNNKVQLEQLERIYQLNQANSLLEAGITLADKQRIEIRGQITAGKDCFIDINCIFKGSVILGDNVTIGAGCILDNVTVADNVTIKPYSILEQATIGELSQVGPYARLRPGTKLLEHTHIGNFVEIKNSTIGNQSKVNHLTYIGDAQIGQKVNIGAGSVTCNYDGKNKFKTIIGDNVFIGSGTMMVAPVVIQQGSLIGAGSVITKNTPANELTISRAKQVTITGWLAKRNTPQGS
ncbi:MAG: UDP-N-acetylglucosamine diphosphorylase/glucosamine-phosphate N-acetyltransferase [Pseudomonadota bacterium]|jgi:bifunctional UDP-N-acetylglucosamine pyrophosphorylase/glucosamine-1-phosphate N-acetyltransferase